MLVSLFFNPEIYDSSLVPVFGLVFGGMVVTAGWWLRKDRLGLALLAGFAGLCVGWVNAKIVLAPLFETPGPDVYSVMQRNLWQSLGLAVSLFVIALRVRRRIEHDGHEAAFMILIGGATASLYAALYCNTHMDLSTYLWQYIGPIEHYTLGPALRLALLFAIVFYTVGGAVCYAQHYRREVLDARWRLGLRPLPRDARV